MTDKQPTPTKLTPTNELLNHLISGSLGPLSRLRDTIDLTLQQVADWIAHPANRGQISNLVSILDAQTQLIICQHRLVAAARLADVAANATSPETVRRACSDLLKIRLFDPYREDKRPERMPPPPPVDEQAILDALAELGRTDYVPVDPGPTPCSVR